MNRYFSLIPVVIIFTTACDQKAPTVESAPRMVKVAQVTAVGNTQQRTFPARIESGDSTELSFKRGGQVESLDIRQGASVAQGQTLARLNAREAQQRVNERQTAATLAQRQFDRFQTLVMPFLRRTVNVRRSCHQYLLIVFYAKACHLVQQRRFSAAADDRNYMVLFL